MLYLLEALNVRFWVPTCARMLVGAAAFIVLFIAAGTTRAATYTVTNTADSGAGSLRDAVTQANSTVTNDGILFNIPTTDAGYNSTTGVYTITLAAEIVIANNGSLTITGPGANRLTIDGGAGTNRIFSVSGATFTLSGATLAGGGGTGATSSTNGGAIFGNGGTTTVRGVYFTGNTATQGGGIYFLNGTNNRVENSTFSGNSTISGGRGGCIYLSGGGLTMVNTTMTNNTAGEAGTAIFSLVGAGNSLILRSDTIVDNSGVIGAITVANGTLDLGNTIIAGNTASVTFPEIWYQNTGSVVSQGYNLVGDSAGDSTNTGTAITYQSTDIQNTPPLLDPVGNYGGTVPTRRPQALSPVVDTGNSLIAGTPVLDARNIVRPFDDPTKTNAGSGNGSDIGAFELQSSIVKDWGFNSSGQLGLGNSTLQNTPQPLTGLNDITQFGGGGALAVALKADGTVITAGSNTNGELGSGTTGGGNRTTFGAVINLTNITQVSGGNNHAVALRSDGTVWAWGLGTSGQLGNSLSASSPTPVQVGAANTSFNGHVIQVSAGNDYTLALTDDAKVWAWGSNNSGQLGSGSSGGTSNAPVAVLVSSGGPQLGGVEQVSAGNAFAIVLKTDGTVYAWGYNNDGELGNGSTNTTGCFCVASPAQITPASMGTIVQISAGDFFTAAINTAGDVYAWGLGGNGQIGDNDTSNALVPRKSGTAGAPLANVVRVEAHGANHALARERDGTMFAWGRNNQGQIGNGSSGTGTTQPTPQNISAVAGTGENLGTNVAVFGTGKQYSFASTLPTASTPSGASVLAGDNFSITFPASTVGGSTQVRAIDPTATGLTAPSGYSIVQNSTGYDISTTATFTGPAQVCFTVSNMIDQNAFGLLWILHDDDGDGTLDIKGMTRNYQTRQICRYTFGFSPFVIANGPANPTAAGVSVSGRVLTSDGRGLRNATVVLIDEKGNARRERTGSLGAFTFTNVSVEQTYVMAIESSTYRYSPRLISLTDAMSNVDFVPTASARGKTAAPAPSVQKPVPRR